MNRAKYGKVERWFKESDTFEVAKVSEYTVALFLNLILHNLYSAGF